MPEPQVTVLIVEDSQLNCELVCELLRAHGYRPLAAGDADAAVQLLRKERPALILMDLYLPRVDGFELTRRLKQDPATCRIPVVAVTALTRAEDHEAAIRAGCEAVIVKPIEVNGFLETLKNYL